MLRQGEEGTAVAEICRKAGVSQATYFNWKKKYGGLLPSEVKRLRQLEEENGRIKRIVADLSLDKEIPSEGSTCASGTGCRAYSSEMNGSGLTVTNTWYRHSSRQFCGHNLYSK